MGQITACQYDVCRAHVKVFFQLVVRLHTLKIRRKRSCKIVVNIGVAVSVNRRDQNDHKQYQKDWEFSGRKRTHFIKFRDQRSVSRLLKRSIKGKDHSRKHGYTAKHTEHNTFCHNDSKVKSERKCHKAHCHETCHCRNGTCDYGADRIGDCMRHGTFLISREPLLILLIAVP